MSDDDELNASMRRWQERLEAGEPIMEFTIDEPFTAEVSATGELVIKFVFGQLGNFETASMALAILTPEAARTLKAMLIAAGNIPDTPSPRRAPQSRN